MCPAFADNTRCNPDDTTSGNIGPSGGTLSTTEVSGTISATLVVPPGALTEETSISLTENGPATRFSIKEDGGTAAVLSMSARPQGQSFAVPVEVTIRWDDRDKDGLVDQGLCLGGADADLPCDHDADCASSACSVRSSVVEADLVLKRDARKFSYDGIGIKPFHCSDHLSGACQTATADCTAAPGSAERTVANCCDPGQGPTGTRTFGEWSFQTCDFSEFFLGLATGDLIVGGGGPTRDCVTEWQVNNPGNETYVDNRGLPSFKQTCTDGDAVCDADGAADGKCVFEIGICFNLEDGRLLRDGQALCTARGLSAWQIDKPRLDDTDRPPNQANALALRGAVAAVASSTIGGDHQEVVTFDPTIEEADICTELARVEVPLKRGVKTGRATLKTVTITPSGDRDSDRLKLACQPPQ